MGILESNNIESKSIDNNTESSIVEENLPPWKSISFACGGWLQFYLYGVARALQAHGLDHPSVTYLGCSAGALAAVGLVLDGDFDAAMDYCKQECVPRAHEEFYGLFQLGEYVSNCLELHLLPKYKPIPVGKLQIAITKLPWGTAERVIQYESQDDLKSALLASAAAFPAAPLVYRHNGWYMDGGISDFQPIIDEETLTVSPFYFSDCDIKPSRYVPLWWAFLPPKSSDTIDWLYDLGYQDTMSFIHKHHIPETNRARDYIQQINKNRHPFDIPRRISMHRFLGYNLGNFTHEYISFVLDFFLLSILLLIGRPLALLLIYIELFIHIVIEMSTTIILEVYDILPLMMFSSIIFYPHQLLSFFISGLICLEKIVLFGASKHVKPKLQICSDCITCVFSLSLLLRFFTPVCSRATLRKHQRLMKVSLLYRIFCHMI